MNNQNFFIVVGIGLGVAVINFFVNNVIAAALLTPLLFAQLVIYWYAGEISIVSDTLSLLYASPYMGSFYLVLIFSMAGYLIARKMKKFLLIIVGCLLIATTVGLIMFSKINF